MSPWRVRDRFRTHPTSESASPARCSGPVGFDESACVGNVGALIIRIGFWGVPYYDYSIIYPQTLF